MRELLRTFPLMCAVLLIPILPFLAFGGQLADWLRGLSENPPAPVASFALVVALLSTDILLPIPSSVISTLSGWQLGWWWGGLATWCGMNLGAAAGFFVARIWGQPLALWFTREADLERARELNEQYGPALLVVTRAMPVLAEASVLMAGVHGMTWRRFLPAIALSNLGIAVAYAGFGDYAEQRQWLPFALGVAVAIPVVIASAGRWLLPRTAERHEGPSAR